MQTSKKNLTDTWLKRAKPAPAGRRYYRWDALLPNFGVRVTGSGTITFIVMRRLDGRLIRRALGEYPSLSLDEAREEARDALKLITRGVDPKEKAAEDRRERQSARAGTFKKVAAAFIDDYAKPRNRRWKESERIFKRYVEPHWGSRPIRSIARGDVIELLDTVRKQNGPIMADRVLAAIRKLFNWRAIRDDKFASPIVRGMASGAGAKRHRILDDDEIRVLWPLLARNEFQSAFGPGIKLMFLTAARKGEIANMRWRDIDQVNAVWTIPATFYKNKRPLVVPLSAQALALINAQKRFTDGDFVITTTGTRPFQGWQKLKSELDALMAAEFRERERGEKPKLRDTWVLHDARRSAKTLMIRAGVRPDISERVLGHVIPGVEGIYDQHSYLTEKRHALETLAATVERIIEPSQQNVVPLRTTAEARP